MGTARTASSSWPTDKFLEPARTSHHFNHHSLMIMIMMTMISEITVEKSQILDCLIIIILIILIITFIMITIAMMMVLVIIVILIIRLTDQTSWKLLATKKIEKCAQFWVNRHPVTWTLLDVCSKPFQDRNRSYSPVTVWENSKYIQLVIWVGCISRINSLR